MSLKKIASILIILVFLVPFNAFSVQPASGQTVATSSGSSLIHFNKNVYSWTDRVYITIYAPDFNSDPNLIDEIGVTSDDKITVSTNGHSIPYHLVETGTNTGIFSGYVTLTGDPTIKGSTGVDGQGTNPTGIQSTCNPTCGPTNGFLPSTGNDGISVSFEYNRDQVITGSALIRWNVGQIKWLAPNYPIGGQAILQITDPDMNLNPDAIDKFDTNVWSDSDSGGIKVSMTETGPDTGIFQGTVYLTSDLSSSGNRLHVSPGDTVTGEYTDTTLPLPHSPSDQMRIVATTTAGSVPPLEQASSSDAQVLDSTGNPLTKVNVNQQIHIVSDVTNNEDKDQPFAYLVQIQDNNGITVSLSWITGSMAPHQTMNLGQSWMPTSPGSYTAQIFVWESIKEPNALATPSTLPIQVR
ncbi:MAG: hypothetical protein KGH76_03505 [Thaumarchaeota archaeon]|nr:hypothetical protein [Nitrososphaerota archaeon]